MVRQRVVVGASGDDERARQAARRLRDNGHEVVFVGGGQSPEQIARTAVAEDATRIVVDAPAEDLARITQLVGSGGLEGPDGIEVTDTGFVD